MRVGTGEGSADAVCHHPRGAPCGPARKTAVAGRVGAPAVAAMVWPLLTATVSLGGTFTVDIERTDSGGVVFPGESVAYVIRGTLTSADGNLGLALFLYDLEVTSAGLSPINLGQAVVQDHPMPGMESFVLGEGGYSGDYNGTAIGDHLEQCGGSQNTIQNDPAAAPFLPFPSGPVIENVGHGAGAILHEGTLTLPMDAALGSYTFRIIPGTLIANQVAGFDGLTYTVASATPVIGASITFDFGCTADGQCGAGQTCDVVTGQCMGTIPTVSNWGTAVMTLLLLSAGTILFSRRRPTAAA